MGYLDQFHDLALLLLTLVTGLILFRGLEQITRDQTTLVFRDHGSLETFWTVLPGFGLLILGLPSLSLLYLIDERRHPSLRLRVLGHQWFWTYSLPELTASRWDSYMAKSSLPGATRLLDRDTRCFSLVGAPIRVLVSRRDVLHA